MQFFRSVQDWVAPAFVWIVLAMLFWLVITGLLGATG
jgi:ABC-type long-subunit fatty acid transport system fused permease/ATPase subunit